MAKYIRQFNHYNTLMLKAAGINHGHCMDNCIGHHRGDPKSVRKYTAHDAVRYLYVIECCRSAQNDIADRKAMHTVKYPLAEKLRRERISS